MNKVAQFQPRQMQLIRETVAADCTAAEFDLYMAAAQSYGLDPFRRQIIPLVFNKTDQRKRRMALVVARDGLRVIASRCGDYRPASEPAEIGYDEKLVSDNNPKGIVSATVLLWKQDNKGDWYPVIGIAHWDEFAPLTFTPDAYEYVDRGEVWADSGKPKKARVLKKDVVKTLDRDGNWGRMPVLMITKCAEAQALRAGWPDQFGGLYAEEEMDQAVAEDMTASEVVAAEEEAYRLRLVEGDNALLVQWDLEQPLVPVKVGAFFDDVDAWTRALEPEEVKGWMVRNRETLKQYWARAAGDALELKKVLEERIAGAPDHNGK